MIDPEFRILRDDEAHVLETTAHNPPIYSEAFTKEDFSREWWSVRDRLADRLQIFGEPQTIDEETGDYALSESKGRDRWIYVTFTSTRLWRPEFVMAVADFLRHLPHDYRIACLTELNDNADPEFNQPMVYLVISADSVAGRAYRPRLDAAGMVVSTPANEALVQIGFPAHLAM